MKHGYRYAKVRVRAHQRYDPRIGRLVNVNSYNRNQKLKKYKEKMRSKIFMEAMIRKLKAESEGVHESRQARKKVSSISPEARLAIEKRMHEIDNVKELKEAIEILRKESKRKDLDISDLTRIREKLDFYESLNRYANAELLSNINDGYFLVIPSKNIHQLNKEKRIIESLKGFETIDDSGKVYVQNPSKRAYLRFSIQKDEGPEFPDSILIAMDKSYVADFPPELQEKWRKMLKWIPKEGIWVGDLKHVKSIAKILVDQGYLVPLAKKNLPKHVLKKVAYRFGRPSIKSSPEMIKKFQEAFRNVPTVEWFIDAPDDEQESYVNYVVQNKDFFEELARSPLASKEQLHEMREWITKLQPVPKSKQAEILDAIRTFMRYSYEDLE